MINLSKCKSIANYIKTLLTQDRQIFNHLEKLKEYHLITFKYYNKAMLSQRGYYPEIDINSIKIETEEIKNYFKNYYKNEK